jgi:hypothetical protein
MHSSICREVTYRSCREGKHERSNHWCLTTAVLGPGLALLMLVVATEFQEPDSPHLFSSTRVPYVGEVVDVMNVATSAAPRA